MDGAARALLRILDWTLERNVFVLSRTTDPSVAIVGPVNRRRLASAYDFNDGCVFVWTDADRYAGGPGERDRFVADLKDRGLLDALFDPVEAVNGGVYLNLRLRDAQESEVEDLLDVMAPHVGL